MSQSTLILSKFVTVESLIGAFSGAAGFSASSYERMADIDSPISLRAEILNLNVLPESELSKLTKCSLRYGLLPIECSSWLVKAPLFPSSMYNLNEVIGHDPVSVGALHWNNTLVLVVYKTIGASCPLGSVQALYHSTSEVVPNPLKLYAATEKPYCSPGLSLSTSRIMRFGF